MLTKLKRHFEKQLFVVMAVLLLICLFGIMSGKIRFCK